MKKIVLLMVVAFCCSYIYAQSEISDTSQTTQAKKRSYGFYKNFSHWSLAISGGFDLLLSERDQLAGEEIKNYKDNFLGEFNFEVEYSINPIWGVALEYAYAPINKKAIFSEDYPGLRPEKNGQGHQVYAMVDVNLLNLFSRYRKHTEWGWYAGIGIGLVTYNTCEQFLTQGKTDVWSVVPMFPFESRVEYSPISSLSIFIKSTLGIYLRDNINVNAKGPLNDWNLYGGLGLRWNINADKKPHVRVTDMNTYENVAKNEGGNCTDTAAQNKLKKLQKQIDDMQKALNENNKNNCCNDLKKVEQKANDNEQEIAKLRLRLDSVKRHTQINSEISDNSVYFDNNSSVISDKYQLIVEKVARVMMAYPTLNVELTSFCSKIGNVEKNKIVGERRIQAVKDLLVNKYKIDEKRIRANYNGQVFEGLESENRRCDLRLVQ